MLGCHCAYVCVSVCVCVVRVRGGVESVRKSEERESNEERAGSEEVVNGRQFSGQSVKGKVSDSRLDHYGRNKVQQLVDNWHTSRAVSQKPSQTIDRLKEVPSHLWLGVAILVAPTLSHIPVVGNPDCQSHEQA